MAGNSKPSVRFDEFVEAARPNAKDTQPLIFVQGYIGKSPAANCIRLYTDPSLNNYVDIPAADIVHSMKVTDDPMGLGGSKLWIKIPTSDNKVKGTYLEGNLYDTYLRKYYDQIKDKFGDLGQATDITRTLATDITKTLATDFTKPAATDFTRVFATDITRVREWIMLRYTRVGTRGCPPGGFRPGANFQAGVEDSFYY